MTIRALVSKGRGPMLEFMPEPEADELAQVIVAFANALGGTVVVGMDDQGRVHGDAVEDLEPVLNRALQMCEPPLRPPDLPELQTEEVANEQVATITVRPTAYRVAARGYGVLVRSGTTNKRVAVAQAEAVRPRAPGFEEEVVPGATLDDLDESIIEEYQRNHIRRGPRGESFSRLELLRDAGALDPTGAPTNSGLLLFGKYPHRFLPQVGVILVRFKGTSVREAVATTERYLRRVEIVGPAARLVERTWEVLFEEIQQQPQVKGLKRQETFDYPVEAVREAVVNAICHRDYSITGQRIEIRLFDDRMEIISPGGLPGHMTLDNILEEHYSRNPRLVRGLYYWGYIEELGQGVDIMYEAMRREHHPTPEFRDTGRNFTVTLLNAVDEVAQLFGDQLNPRQARALRFLETNERITNRDYRELCPDVTPETIRLDLRDLVEKGILLKIGDKRGTCYVRK